MYHQLPIEFTRGDSPGDYVVTLDQVPWRIDAEYRWTLEPDSEDSIDPNSHFPDPLTPASTSESESNGLVSRFPVDHEIDSKVYLWRGYPWNLEVDAVVNSTNENLDEAHSSPGLHAAAGLVWLKNVLRWKVVHTVGPKYAVKYHTAAENALSHRYRSCLELLIENGLRSIAMGCIYRVKELSPPTCSTCGHK